MRIVRTLARHHALRLSNRQADVITQRVEGGVIRRRTRANRNVTWRDRAQSGKKLEAHELAKPSLHTVSANSAVFVTRNHDRDPRMTKRGSENSDIEVRRPNTPPLSNDILDVGTSRQSLPAREAKAARPVRRLRTCLAA